MARWAFNPLTNELDRIGDDGGGGGGDVTIRGEDGSSITGDDFTFSGQKYGASETPISEVDTSTGEVVTSVNAWETPYVVDSSTIEGEKGTYTTIQAAIDAAVIDGATLTNSKVIVLRAGIYEENLSIPPGIFLRGQNLISSITPAAPEVVEVHGNHVLSGANLFRAQGISFRNPVPSERMFSIAPGENTVFFNLIDCWINNNSGTLPAITTDFQYNRFVGCTFNAPAYSNVLEVLTGAVVSLSNCVFTAGQKILNAGQVELWSSQVGEIVCDGGQVFAYGSNFRGELNCISGSAGTVSLNGCRFSSLEGAVNVTSIASNLVTMNNCSIFEGGQSLYSPGSSLEIKSSQCGNVIPHIEVSDNYNLISREQLLYCNTENNAISLNLPANAGLDRIWTIKDSFGNASVNNITISLAGKTIDKQPSYVIDSDFGCVTVQATETGDFVVLSETKTSGGGSTPSIKITKFFTDGTWGVDPLAKMSRHLIWSGGGGGASGRSGASANSSGGGGGAPGSFVDALVDHSTLTESAYSVIVGLGGIGGLSVSGTGVSGNPGSKGGDSSVGDPAQTGLVASGGNGGGGGGLNSGAGGSDSRFLLAGASGITVSGGNGTQTSGLVEDVFFGAAAGGAGGPGYRNGIPMQGRPGGAIFGSDSTFALAQGGLGGSNSGGNGGDGNTYSGPLLSIGGSGGGAGGHDGVTTAGSGGNGGTPGGGGGGGAGNLSDNPSGAGGNGGDGRVIIIEYF